MIVKLLTEHHMTPLSLKSFCTGLSESTHVKIPHCWKSHVAAQICFCMANLCKKVTQQIWLDLVQGLGDSIMDRRTDKNDQDINPIHFLKRVGMRYLSHL